MAIPSKLAHVVYMTRRYDEMISCAFKEHPFEAKPSAEVMNLE